MLTLRNLITAGLLTIASSNDLAANSFPERPSSPNDTPTRRKDSSTSPSERADQILERLVSRKEISPSELNEFRNIKDPTVRLAKVREFAHSKSSSSHTKTETKKENNSSESSSRNLTSSMPDSEIADRQIKLLLRSYPNDKQEIEDLRKIVDPIVRQAETHKLHFQLVRIEMVKQKAVKALEYKIITTEEAKDFAKLGNDLNALEEFCDKRNLSNLIFMADMAERNLKFIKSSKKGISEKEIIALRALPIPERYEETTKLSFSR